MGGMGITRNAHWLVDTFSFFMPMAAGMDPKHAQESFLATYFDTTYYHLQGLNDHFREFITRCENQTKEVEKLEMLYAKKSGFKVEYYNGSHNYDKNLLTTRLAQLFDSKVRNLYKQDLHGIFYWTDRIYEDNNIKFNLKSNSSYFWLEVKEFHKIKDELSYMTSFKANIENNEININFTDVPKIKKLRVYLSKTMVALNKPVRIYVNNKLYFDGLLKLKPTEMSLLKQQKADPNFNYSTYTDLSI